MKNVLKAFTLAAGLTAGLAQASLVATPTGPFQFLDDAYTAEIVSVNGQGGVGITFDQSGHLIRRDFGSGLYTHSLTADTTTNGANTIHSSTYTPLSGSVSGSGYGIVMGDDGYVYAQSGEGLKKIDPATGVSTATSATTSGYYGIKKQPGGKLVYNDFVGNVHRYDPVTDTDSVIYSSGIFSDDIAVDPSGNIFVAVLSACRTDILDPNGNFLRSSVTGHCADGMAFGQGSIFKNNTDGTLTKLSYSGANYTGSETETIMASWSGYGDLADVGPDNAFYVNGYGFNYPSGAYANAWTVVRISLADGGGGFGNEAPEPQTLALTLMGLAGLAWSRRRQPKA